mgnify:CR=1 FL=1
MRKILLTSTLLIGLSSLSQGQTSCLVAKYKFAGNAKDSSGNGYDLTASGATLTKDRFARNNQAYHFDGNQYLWATATPAFSNDKFSIAFWAKPESGNSGNNRIIAVGPGSTYWHYYSNTIVSSLDRIGFVAHDVNGNYNFNDYVKKSFTTNKWVHIVSTYDGDSIKMYVDGTLNFASKVAAKVIKFTTNKYLQIGAAYYPDSPKAGYIGDLDDIGIYCKALSGAEIKDLYTKEATLSVNDNFIANSKLSIFPNPANDIVSIEYSINGGINLKGELYNSQGQIVKVLESISGSGNINFKVDDLTPGIYFVKFNNESSGASKILKLSIN